MKGAKNVHQNTNSPISEQVLPVQIPFGSYVCQFGSSIQVLGEALGIALGLIDGADDGFIVGTKLGIKLG